MPTVFFLSDYGTQDEFVGVVHAVIAAGAPGTLVIDLTHQVPAFDVAAGSEVLVRSVRHLGLAGGGVVLAVVDPGVGTARRGVCLEARVAEGGVMWFVGPDNGLLVAAAELMAPAGSGATVRAIALAPRGAATGVGSTFDGRDLFAPAVAALCRGVGLEALGRPIDPVGLVRLSGPEVQCRQDADGNWTLQAEVSWVDGFGNVQLAVGVTDVGTPPAGPVVLGRSSLRWVASFGYLGSGELGLMWDANGRLAIVAGQASAASLLGLSVGDRVALHW